MAATKYTIAINRRSGEKGKLTFSHGNITVVTDCWWTNKNRIHAGTYIGAKTYMAEKDAPGIYLGQGVPSNIAVNNGIFIHRGLSPGWSDGCIVAAEDQVSKIWNTINPQDAYIVKIKVIDVANNVKVPYLYPNGA